MSQTATLIVESVVDKLIDVEATVDGEVQTVKMPGIEVATHSPDKSMFPVLRFRGDLDAIRAAYVVGAVIDVVFTVREGE